MLIKSADDRTKDIETLESLLAAASGKQRSAIEDELRQVRAGIKGEKESAYLIDFAFRDSKNACVIHDLRIEANGWTAQIDHLIINRFLHCFVLETKRMHAGVKITEDGEFLRWNDFKKTYEGMASPIEQNKRHIAVLKDALKDISLPTRLGFTITPQFFQFILLPSAARVDRPKKFDSSCVIKADHLVDSINKAIDAGNMFGTVARAVSAETMEKVARDLVALHRPITINFDAKFGGFPKEPKAPPPAPQAAPVKEIPKVEYAHQCRGCGATDVTIVYGKFGYYFKCAKCEGNTPIKLGCGREGHAERLRKDGALFYRECSSCKTSTLFYTNP